MRILEWAVSSLFYVISLWDKSHDKLLNKQRAYERRILVAAMVALAFMLVAILITPVIEINSSENFKYAAYIVERYIGMGAFLLSTIFVVVSLWNIIVLVYFHKRYGISG